MYYKPKFLPTLEGYLEWKNKSPKMVHAQAFSYVCGRFLAGLRRMILIRIQTFRDIEKFIHDDEAEGMARQSQK